MVSSFWFPAFAFAQLVSSNLTTQKHSSHPCYLGAMFPAALLALALAPALPQSVPVPAPAPAATAPIRVGICVEPPFITKDAQGAFSGYSYELWQKVGAKLGVPTVVTEHATFAELLAATTRGDVDVAVTDAFITSAREEKMDFSHAIADGGLRVMVNADPKYSIVRLFQELAQKGHLAVLGYGAICVVTLSILLMFVWRRIDKDFPQTSHHDAFAEAFYRTTALTVMGKTKVSSTSTWYTKILAAVWLFFGVGIVAYVTSSVTSVMTAQTIKHEIGRVEDLMGKTVGVITGTVSHDYCTKHGYELLAYPSLQDAADALVARHIDAVVNDGPILEAFDHAHPTLHLTVTGPMFEERDYGFAFPQGSNLRHRVNIALLELMESQDIAQLHAKYFGNS